MKSFGSALAVLVLLLGGTALAYAQWTHAIDAGDAALAAGQFDSALASYTVAEARFDRIPAAKQLFASDYQHAVANELSARYRLGHFDEVIERAEHAPDATVPHFWSGCAFFQKAVTEEKPDARLGWLSRAEDELHKAVEATPDDWDTKYDFELTTRLASELRRQPKTPPKQLMQLLRPPQTGAKQQRRVG
jgi:tetratricopeptide (TPR) repeat protein